MVQAIIALSIAALRFVGWWYPQVACVASMASNAAAAFPVVDILRRWLIAHIAYNRALVLRSESVLGAAEGAVLVLTTQVPQAEIDAARPFFAICALKIVGRWLPVAAHVADAAYMVMAIVSPTTPVPLMMASFFFLLGWKFWPVTSTFNTVLGCMIYSLVGDQVKPLTPIWHAAILGCWAASIVLSRFRWHILFFLIDFMNRLYEGTVGRIRWTEQVNKLGADAADPEQVDELGADVAADPEQVDELGTDAADLDEKVNEQSAKESRSKRKLPSLKNSGIRKSEYEITSMVHESNVDDRAELGRKNEPTAFTAARHSDIAVGDTMLADSGNGVAAMGSAGGHNDGAAMVPVGARDNRAAGMDTNTVALNVQDTDIQGTASRTNRKRKREEESGPEQKAQHEVKTARTNTKRSPRRQNKQKTEKSPGPQQMVQVSAATNSPKKRTRSSRNCGDETGQYENGCNQAPISNNTTKSRKKSRSTKN